MSHDNGQTCGGGVAQVGPAAAIGGRLALALLTVAISVSMLACRGAPIADGPNVILISIDTLRADRVGAYGGGADVTPTLDMLAREGTRFDTAIAPTPLTLPSHTTLLTGLYPPRHGVRHNGMFRLPESLPTLASQLRSAGYATAAFVGAIVLEARFGLDHGFEHYDDRMSAVQANGIGYQEQPAEVVTQRALDWLDRNEKPFFLFVHYYDAHFAYAPPEPFAQRFADDPYSGEIAYVDAQIGRLLDGVRKAGDFDDTLVIVTSDHGESLDEHEEPTHGYTIYDATQRVPLIVRGPGVPAGRVVSTAVSSVDVTPTVLARIGAPAIDSDGLDLAGLWSDEEVERDRDIYAETLATQLDHGLSALHSVRADGYLYIRAPRPELYDLDADPRQLSNLAEQKPGTRDRLLERMESRVDAFLAAEREAPQLALDETTVERLRALGYAVNPEPRPASNIDPKDGLKWALRYFDATKLVQEGRYDEARVILEPMLAALPESAWAHYSTASIHVGEGNPELGLPHAEKAARLIPGYSRFQFLYADLLLSTGNGEEAKRVYEAAIELDPESPSALYVRMRWASERGEVREAVRLADALVRADPFNERNLLEACQVLELHNQTAAALEVARRMVRAHPESERAHMMLAVRLARAGLIEESDTELAKAGDVAQEPDSINDLARALALAGHRDRAETLWLKIADRHALAQQNLDLLRRLEHEEGPGAARQPSTADAEAAF